MEALRTRKGKRTSRVPATQARPRSPGLAYAVVTVALAVLVGALALTSRPSAPPTIAEFAPRAVEQIGDSTSDSAGGRGGAAGETSTLDEHATEEAAAAHMMDVARVRRCVGDPPRQIEDPQSPPCVPYWEGDNGGATYKGVSRDEIRIAGFWGGVNLALERFFNSRFEFYGRRIRLINTNSDAADCTPAGREKKAVAADEQWKVFASLFDGACLAGHYDVALARRGIISTLLDQTFTEPFLREHAPYIWSYPMGLDAAQTVHGDWACTRLAGRPARYAKGPEALERRVFGIFAANLQAEIPISSAPLQSALRACGERSAATFEMSNGVGWFPPDPQAAQWSSNVMLQMRQNGVTSIFCLCHPGAWMQLGAAATRNGYFPEWLIGTYDLNDFNSNVHTWGPSAEQRSQAMGLTFLPRQTKLVDNPGLWAEAEAGAPPRAGTAGNGYALSLHYRNLLMLASGIQMAGPNLTPATFETGLHKTRFPNPDHPIKAGAVGFEDGDYSMTNDAAEYWWSNTEKGPYNDDRGTICYVDHGERRVVGRFPEGDEPFFKLPCDSGA